MSAKSIKLFEQAHPPRAPALQDRLRREAAELRHKAHNLLNAAARLEAMADELEGK